MTSTQLFLSGARLVRRHLRIVVWIFVVNLVLAWLGAAPARTSFRELMDHSLASDKLVSSFDAGTLVEVLREPSIQLHSFSTASLHFALIFLLYMVFIDGGVLTVYREDRKLTRAEFFEMSGGFFWRMFRLVLLSCVPFAMLGGIYSTLADWSDKLTSDAANARTGFWVLVISCVVLWVAMLFVRAWFDLAQSITVADNERGMLRTSWRALVLSCRNLGVLVTTYVTIHCVGIVAIIALFVTFLYVPHARFRLSFVVLEAIVLVDIVVRLWQKAACMTWLEGQPRASLPVFEPAPAIVVQEPIAPPSAPEPPVPEQP